MTTTAKELRQEHTLIERELIELNTIIHSSVINYPNLLHVLKKLKNIWDPHEEKEMIFFNDLYKKGFTVPLNRLNFEHGKLRRFFDNLMEAIKTGKENTVHDSLFRDGKSLIDNLRKHMQDEDWILVALPKRYRE